MHSRVIIFLLSFLGISLLLDFYAYQVVRAAVRDASPEAQRIAFWAFWSFPVLAFLTVVFYIAKANDPAYATARAWAAGFYMAHLVFGLLLVVFAGVDDVRRILFAILKFVGVRTNTEPLAGLSLSRSTFLSQLGLGLAAIPAVGMIYGVARGGHRYQVLRRKIVLPNLPEAFEGYTIVQLSDIHSGSFFSRAGVQKGIDLINAQKADLVVFTGDLVNNIATEIEPWISYFKQITSPHGVYSILGNHDYGDYLQWESRLAKDQNLRRLKDNHARLGWELLLDEHRFLEKDGQKIALIGIQNWGAKANFPKYGNLPKAYAGTESAPVKILLSHDPSHWRAQVRPEYPDIDLMLAGHTHGMQFGIDSEVLKWSPVQYVYKEWADLYEDAGKFLYVNRGFGFIGYPGRFGIWPEITVLELTRGEGPAA